METGFNLPPGVCASDVIFDDEHLIHCYCILTVKMIIAWDSEGEPIYADMKMSASFEGIAEEVIETFSEPDLRAYAQDVQIILPTHTPAHMKDCDDIYEYIDQLKVVSIEC